jgi:predicted DNA-binding transcriptional regulator AlpA
MATSKVVKAGEPPMGSALHFVLRELADVQAGNLALKEQLRARGGQGDAGDAYPVGHDMPEQFLMFYQLPDDSLVDIHVVALLIGCSVATAWRRVRGGLLPQPEHFGGATRWRVSLLHAAQAAIKLRRKG